MELALRHISNCIKNGNANSDNPFTRICICLDNLDQSPLDVQSFAMALVRRWLDPESGFHIWKFIIPLWPTTLELIKQHNDPLPKGHDILLGSPETSSLLSIRTEKIQKHIGRTRDTIAWNDSTGKEIPVTSMQNQQYLQGALDYARPSFHRFVEKVSGGSARQQLKLWELTLSSQTVYNAYLRQLGMATIAADGGETEEVEKAFEGIRLAYLYDGMLTGKHLVHHRTRHPVANVFFMLPQASEARDSLIGLHILYLILKRRFHSGKRIEEFLRPLGYERDKIEMALDAFHNKHFFAWVSGEEKDLFVFNPRVGEAHYDLLNQKIYIDNMAMVTPVREEALRAMCHTNYDVERFTERIKTTLKFIDELYSDEQIFRDPRLCPRVLEIERFSESIESIKFPWFFKMIAVAYLKNLEAIRERAMEETKVIIDKNLNIFKAHRVFKMIASLPDHLEVVKHSDEDRSH